MKRVLLVPHGQTPWNVAGRFQGHTDIGMNAHGIEQARRLAASLRGEKIAAILSSDLKRAHETALIIAESLGLPVRTDARLRELNFGTWEGLTGAEVAVHDPAGWERWERGSAADFPGGETLAYLATRARSCFQEALEAHRPEEGALMMFAHRGTFRVLLSVILGQEPLFFRRFYLDQTSVSEVWCTPHETVLYRLNDTHHLREMVDVR